MERCKTKFVPKMVREEQQIIIRERKSDIRRTKSHLKKAKTNEEKDSLNRVLKFLKKPQTKKSQKKQKEDLVKVYCNPDCVGTQLEENADYKKLADNYCKLLKCSKKNSSYIKKSHIKTLKQVRKMMRMGRKTLLENSFFHGFPKTKRAILIKDGALSGCIPYMK